MTNAVERSQRFAPDSAIWVCGACGKTAKDRYGEEGENSPGWDESCMLNAVLCDQRTRQPIAREVITAVTEDGVMT